MDRVQVVSTRQFAAIILSTASMVWLMGGISVYFAIHVSGNPLLVPGGDGFVGQVLRGMVDILPLSCAIALVGGWICFAKNQLPLAFKLQALPFLHLILIALAIIPVIFLCGADKCF
ncbi:membrane hypothetical protein [Rhodospirillaceae bacterium LM-1]|nr:membrane hypothetical protein [Rhodospirillaceae bacterium LM-1]